MDSAIWIDLLMTILVSPVFFLLFQSFLKSKSLLYLYFSVAAFIMLSPYLAGLFQLNTAFQLQEWAKLVSVTVYISGLLVMIRESKPVFARFPQRLTALPFVSFLFFPLIIDSFIIKELLNATYQGGALVVTILVFTINHAQKKRRRYYILGISLVTVAYLSYWLVFNRNPDFNLVWLSETFMAAGMLITTLRFDRSEIVVD